MMITQFEDIIARQKAKQLTTIVYGDFKNNHDYGFKDQIQRASTSIMNNIAEGFERKSNKKLKQYLFIAKGSCGEVRSMLHLSKELRYQTPKRTEDLIKQSTEISKMLSGFIKSL